MQIIWVVQRRVGDKWISYSFGETRREARDWALFYNGFSHRTKNASYRVRKYMEVGK